MTRPGSASATAHRAHGSLLGMIAGVVVALVLGGCGSSTGQTAGEATPTAHGRGDTTFARAMLASDGRARMVERWAQGRATSPAVRAMASRMMRSQDRWDEELRSCVSRWSGSSPQRMMMSLQGSGQMMANGHLTGMMSRPLLKSLKSASGPAFDRTYLVMMVRHHASMITAATFEARGGRDPAVMRLARHIRRTQTRELTELRRLLRR